MRIAALRARGMPNKEIAKLLEISVSLITRVVQESGLPRRRRGGVSRERVEEIRSLRDRGMSVADICMRTGLREGTLYRLMRKEGIARKPRENGSGEKKKRGRKVKVASKDMKVRAYEETLSVIMAKSEGELGKIAENVLRQMGALVE